MSIKIMSRVWESADSSLGELLVLLAIADHCNDKGFAWPSVESLARKSRLSERQTRYIIRNLESKGYLKTHFNQGPHGCNLYQVTVREGAVSAPGAVCDTKGGSLQPKGGQPIAPESSVNRQEPGEPQRKIGAGDRIILDKEYDRVLEEMRAIKRTYADHQTWNTRDVDRWRELVARKQELKKQLGIKV